MSDYDETIEQLENEIEAIHSILPNGSLLTREAMQDAITLLQHYREGLETIYKDGNATYNSASIARKTLEES